VAPRYRTTKLALAIVAVLAAVAASANVALDSSRSGPTTHVFAPSTGQTDWWPFLSK